MSAKGKTSEKNPTADPKKGASDPDPKGKGDAHELDLGAGIPSKGGPTTDGSGGADSFIQDQVGGMEMPGTDSSGAGAITDSFGGSGDRTDVASDLLNPDLPSSGQGSTPGTASWEDGPSDPSGGLTTGTDVANVADRMADYDDAVAEYEKTDQTWDDYNDLQDKLDDIDDANPKQTSVDEFFGFERDSVIPAQPAPEQPLAAVDSTDLDQHVTIGSDGHIYHDSGDGSLVRDGFEGEDSSQSVAPGTADGVLLEQDQQTSSESVIVAEDDGLTEYEVNQQSSEGDVTYGFDKKGDFYAVDGNNNATPIDRDDVPPGTRVRDLDNTLGENGEGDFDQPEKTDDGKQAGTDSEDSSDQDSSDQDADGEASDEQGSDDGAEEGSDASTPSGEGTGAERAAQAEDLRQQGFGELVDRRDPSGDAIDPGDIDTIEGGGGQPTGDAGISNPEGTTPLSGGGRAPSDPGNIDYGEDSDRQYDGRERSPADEVSVDQGSGLEGYTPDSDDGLETLDPAEIDLGPPTVAGIDVPDTTTETADEPIEFGGGIATPPNERIDGSDYGTGDPGPVETSESDGVRPDIDDLFQDPEQAQEYQEEAHVEPAEDQPHNDGQDEDPGHEVPDTQDEQERWEIDDSAEGEEDEEVDEPDDAMMD